MKIHQVRNATIIITYNNKRFLIDPWFMPKNYMPGFEGAVNSETRQPRVELPVGFVPDKLNLDAIILTHFHPDHWDEFAAKILDKNLPFFVQSEFDKNIIENYGFKNIKILTEKGFDFDGIKLYKTNCQHGRREIVKPMCEQIGMPYDAMGIMFMADTENTLYVAGDTIWCDEVESAIDKYTPDVIVINACGATVMIGDGERLIMNKDDVIKISEYAKHSTIVASHMDTVSHRTVTREDIRGLKLENVLVPEDGEILEF